VILVVDGEAYEVVSGDEQGSPVVFPVTLTQEPGITQPASTPEPLPISLPERPKSGGLLCAGGLLPLLVLGMMVFVTRRQA
jgi:hypothetical protein